MVEKVFPFAAVILLFIHQFMEVRVIRGILGNGEMTEKTEKGIKIAFLFWLWQQHRIKQILYNQAGKFAEKGVIQVTGTGRNNQIYYLINYYQAGINIYRT